jgi:plastocyanin
MIDGFKHLGSPPPAKDAGVLEIGAKEYAYDLSESEVAPDFVIKFHNEGKEAHEISLFKGPDGVRAGAAKRALEELKGEHLEDLPTGYEADHLIFAQPGGRQNLSFAEPVAAGTYVLACYIPEGGFDKKGDPVDPDAKTHIQLGMISVLEVG